MKKYIGTKQIEASPMTMGEAHEKGLLQADRVPNEAQKTAPGYHVRYPDGYESWSPAETFEKTYRVADTFLDRMYIELGDLNEKRRKLGCFIESDNFKKLPSSNQHLLMVQIGVMTSYAYILLERIISEEKEEEKEK